MTTISATKQIMQALAISYMIYDNYREACFLNWCKIYCKKFGISLRAMTRHDGLRNWYHDNWFRTVEEPFIRQYGDFFGKADPYILMDVIATYPSGIDDIWPGPLLKMIKEESNAISDIQRIEAKSTRTR